MNYFPDKSRYPIRRREIPPGCITLRWVLLYFIFEHPSFAKPLGAARVHASAESSASTYPAEASFQALAGRARFIAAERELSLFDFLLLQCHNRQFRGYTPATEKQPITSLRTAGML